MTISVGWIKTGTGLITGDCASWDVTGVKDYFLTGEKCVGMMKITYVDEALNYVDYYWETWNGTSWVTQDGPKRIYGPGAPPPGTYFNCSVYASWWDYLPQKLVAGPGNTRIRFRINGVRDVEKWFSVAEQSKNIRIEAAIKNTGTQSLNLILGYMIDSATDWTKNSVFSLSPGQQTTITFNTTAKLGSHTLYTRLWLSDMTYMDSKQQTFSV